MTGKPRVSVILPAFNRMSVLPRAVDSVLRQSYRSLELIVVDDGSTDGTAAYAGALGDPRVRLLRRERGGAGAARNTGLRAARGQFVAFQDSDDEWLPDKLARQVEVLDGADASTGAVVCGYREIAQQETTDFPARQGPPTDLLVELLRGRNFITPTWLVRRPALDGAGPFDESLPSCEDYDLLFRLLDVCRVEAMAEILVLKHDSPGSVYNDRRRRAEGRRLAVEKHRLRWREHRAWLADQERTVGSLLLRDRRIGGVGYLLRALARDPASQLRWLRQRLRRTVTGPGPA